MKRPHFNVPVILLYVLFGFGGLWQVLNLFQPLMRLLVSPLLIIVSIGMAAEAFRNTVSARDKTVFVFWSVFTAAAGWAVEYLGIRTGMVFGHYQYGPVLQPQIAGVPAAIGFSWLSVSLSSLVMARRIVARSGIKGRDAQRFFQTMLTAGLMVLFDFIMEQAAPKLDYWTWENGRVPVNNYIAWFIIGMLFSQLWSALKIRMSHFPQIVLHVYFAQLIYFIWILPL